jgi:hypothetical protein
MGLGNLEVYIGDVLLQPTKDVHKAEASAKDSLNPDPSKLTAIAEQIATVFASMRPPSNLFEGERAADTYEIEIGFSLEIGAGDTLKLFLSPKIGMACKATMQWKKV